MSADSPSNQFRRKKSIRQSYHGNLPRFTTVRNRDFKIACKFHAGTTLSPTTACNLCVSLHAVYYWPRWFQNQPENSAMQATFKSLPPPHDGLLNAAWKENYTHTHTHTNRVFGNDRLRRLNSQCNIRQLVTKLVETRRKVIYDFWWLWV